MAEFKDVIYTRDRMCNIYYSNDNCRCLGCPMVRVQDSIGLNCSTCILEYPGRSEDAIMDWGKRHPVKTILDEFKKNYPNAPLRTDGTPYPCPEHLGYKASTSCGSCVSCWDRPMEVAKND